MLIQKYLKELTKKKLKKISHVSTLTVQDLISKEGLASVLDFGCGKGMPFTQLKDVITVHNYDPVTSPIPLPNDSDIVYSSDVLEHIEVDQLDQVIDKLYNIASKYQYHLIACHPAKKKLSDGRNAHLIIEKPEWWKAILDKKNKELGWEMISEESTDRMVSLKKGPDIRVIKYIVYLEKV